MSAFVNPNERFPVEFDGITFQCSILTGEQAIVIGALASAQNNASAMRHAVECGLKGWAGEGAPPFPIDIDKAIGMLSFGAFNALSTAIVERSESREPQTGN